MNITFKNFEISIIIALQISVIMTPTDIDEHFTFSSA